MTLLDLINKLQKEKKIVARWEFFLRGDDFIDDEDLFCLRPGRMLSTHIDQAYLPPRMIELGDAPRYVWIGSKEEYEKLTGAQDVPGGRRFPVLLIHVPLVLTAQGFVDRYFGKYWHEVSPTEWNYVEVGGYTPFLDRFGMVINYLERGIPRSESCMNFYFVRSPYGNDFAWGGDLSKDKLPEGLSLVGHP